MSQWIDFKELRKRLQLSAVLELYGVKVKVKGDQAQGSCRLPTHKSEARTPSFSANLTRGIWQCFGCGAKGNVLDLAIRMEGLSPDQTGDVRAVALKLAGHFQIAGALKGEPNTHGSPDREAESDRPASRPGRQGAEKSALVMAHASATCIGPVQVNEPLDFELKNLQPDHPYLLGRGFTPDTIRHFGLGFCSRGSMAGRVVIPLHNECDRLVGYAGRLVNDGAINAETPKYKVPSRRERHGVVHEFHKSYIVYNANRLTGMLDHLVVVEGFPSVWWLHQAGIEHTVALMGSSCSPEQAAILLAMTSATTRFTIFPDGDEAGERFAQSVFAALGSRRWMRFVRLGTDKQPTDCDPEHLNQILRA